ncbi:MAG: hypothetical protein KKC14_16490 [Alphaproteobacteria bacterium]|nr:hypothetical protein [Alphaproteobacteria bacterium]
MNFFCYVYSHGSDVPHMEALACQTLGEAQRLCRRLMREHAAATRAELFDDDDQLAVIFRDEVGGEETHP